MNPLQYGTKQVSLIVIKIHTVLGIGGFASRLFVPLLQVVRDAEQTVPPIRVVSLALDQIRIAGFVIIMLALGFVILSVFLFRIRIHQAVKLGEE